MKKVLNFFKTLISKIGALFSALPAELKQVVSIAVVLTENIKKFVDSPVADILTALIPGEADDRIKALLRAYLPGLLINLNLFKECADQPSIEEQVKCAVRYIQGLPDGNERTKILQQLSGNIAELAADGKFDWADSVYLAKWYYQNKFKN